MARCEHDAVLYSGECADCGKPIRAPREVSKVLGVNQHPPVLTGRFRPEEDGDGDGSE